MRRAMRHAQLLGARDPLMHRLVPILVREMGRAYPEIVRAEALVSETLRLEETRFRKTLERGLAILEGESEGLGSGAKFSGETAFKLYDTYGFPLDLTEDALRARGISVDVDSFSAAMERQRAEARASWAGSGEAATDAVWFGVRDDVGVTEFLGYETESAEGAITALISDGRRVNELPAGTRGLAVLNQTPFYAESGGQVGDTGRLTGEGGLAARILGTQKKLGDIFAHEVEVESGTLSVGAPVALSVDRERRGAIRANHSATHLLHEALRRVLGDHVAQKGSLVAADRLRFDFSHPKPLEESELRAVEDIANRIVLRNEPVVTRLMAVDDAITSGARALFGEKYGEEVRVVSMGTDPGNGAPYSVELCGGTHVARTGDIGIVSVLGESAVAAGVRRIEAMTADVARHHLNEQTRALRGAAGLLKAPVVEIEARVAQLVEERRKLERELGDARRKLAMGGAEAGEEPTRLVGSVKLLARQVSGIDLKDLKALADEGKKRLVSGVVAIVGVTDDGRAGLVVGVTDDLTGTYDAVALVRRGAEALGGKGGGGRADMAQAGGPDGARAAEALAAIEAALVG
jgi:alanyl-tRNA synthetase